MRPKSLTANPGHALGPDEQPFLGSRILVTGGRGFIGSAFTEYLSHLNCEIVVLDRQESSAWIPSGRTATFGNITGDIADPIVWNRLTNDAFDWIFHLASEDLKKEGYDCESDYRSNALATFLMLDAVSKWKRKPRIVFTSSVNVFGTQDSSVVSERCVDRPNSLWSLHKALAEQYLRYFRAEFEIESVILRLPNVYGISPRKESMPKAALNRAISNCIKNGSLVTFKNRNRIRDYVYIDDVLTSLRLCGRHFDELKQHEKLNIGAGTHYTIGQVWSFVAETCGRKLSRTIPVRSDDLAYVMNLEMRNYGIDFSLFSTIAGWQPLISIETGIERVAEYCFANPT